MHRVTIIIFIFVILNRLNLTSCLVEISPFGDNVIDTKEVQIRDIFNRLLNILKIVPENLTEIEDNFSLIYKYLINTTLHGFNTRKDIVQLTRPSKVKENEENYMDLINDILNEDIVDTTELTQDEKTLQVINDFINKLEHLKSLYNPIHDVNKLSLNLENDTLDNIIEDSRGESSLDVSYENHTSPYWIPDDGVELINYRRIYHGKGTKIKHFPFVAAVLLFQIFYCAGSIISSDLIITAASCLQLAWNNRLFRENPAFISVRVGSSFHAGGGENIAVNEVYFHPTYDPKTLYGNLCILRLQKHLKFSGKKKRRIKKIMYDTNDNALPVDTPGVTIIGWGAKQTSNVIKFTDPIHFAILDIYPPRDCQDVYSKKYVRKQNFCAGFISKGSGACNHDVGNPGIVGGVLVGVVSFGSPVCGTPDAPTVFTKIGYYSDWIEDIIELDVPTKYVRTTTMTPWTAPTYITTTPTTLMPNRSFLEWLRTYYKQNKNLYKGLLKTLTKKEIDLFIDEIRNIDVVEDQTITPINGEIQTAIATTTPYTEEKKSTIVSKSSEEMGHTQGEPFVDKFESYTKKKHNQKRSPKHRHQFVRTRKPKKKTKTTMFVKLRKLKTTGKTAISEEIRKPKQLTSTINTAAILEEIPKPKFILNSYDYINVAPSSEEEIYESLSLPAEKVSYKQYQHRGGKDSLTTTNDIENVIIKDQREDIHDKDATSWESTTKYVSHISSSLEDEIPLHTSTLRTSHLPKVTLLDKMSDEIDNYDHHLVKDIYGGQVEAAEDFFTHSILDYLAHRDKTKSRESNEELISRAKLWTESDSDNDVTNETQVDPNIQASLNRNKDDEKYVAYLKSLNPAQFYELLSLAIAEIDKEFMKT